MHKTTLEFLKAGLHTLIQDQGRADHRAFGVPIGGALDRSSSIIANQLVGNDMNSPVIEITISGPTIGFKGDDCLIAITGADISPTLDGRQIEMYRNIRVTKSSVLAFGKLNTGSRAYLAVNGDWQVRKWLDSASALFPDIPEVTPDSFIVKGSTIEVKHSGKWMYSGKFRALANPQSLKPAKSATHLIRVLPGPEINMFSKDVLERFFSLTHAITPASNRWGYRLDIKLYTLNSGQEIISSGVFPGTIQILHSGQPIILMADAQTTGGYPRIAVVISADMDQLAQAKPGDVLGFRQVGQSEAFEAMQSRDRQVSRR
jgi:biotin-dependent carboxylase-like uncharacterized protein